MHSSRLRSTLAASYSSKALQSAHPNDCPESFPRMVSYNAVPRKKTFEVHQASVTPLAPTTIPTGRPLRMLVRKLGTNYIPDTELGS